MNSNNLATNNNNPNTNATNRNAQSNNPQSNNPQSNNPQSNNPQSNNPQSDTARILARMEQSDRNIAKAIKDLSMRSLNLENLIKGVQESNNEK